MDAIVRCIDYAVDRDELFSKPFRTISIYDGSPQTLCRRNAIICAFPQLVEKPAFVLAATAKSDWNSLHSHGPEDDRSEFSLAEVELIGISNSLQAENLGR